MTDLLERLRSGYPAYFGPYADAVDCDMNLAADEIEALRKERDTYKDLHQAVTNANVDLSQEKAALNDWVQGQAIDIRDYKDEIDKFRDQITRYRAVMEQAITALRETLG